MLSELTYINMNLGKIKICSCEGAHETLKMHLIKESEFKNYMEAFLNWRIVLEREG